MKGFFSGFLALCKNKNGANALEFALILPLIIAVGVGAMDFGIWFYQYEIATRAVNNISYDIMQNPTNAGLQAIAQQSGLSNVNFSSPNYICAQSYGYYAGAAAGLCNGGWTTTRPGYCTSAIQEAGGVADGPTSCAPPGPYFVAVQAHVVHTPLAGLPNWLGNITVNSVFQVMDVEVPPECQGDQFLQYNPAFNNGNNPWKCIAPPTCNQPGTYLQYSAAYAAANPDSPTGGWQCSAPPPTTPGPSSFLNGGWSYHAMDACAPPASCCWCYPVTCVPIPTSSGGSTTSGHGGYPTSSTSSSDGGDGGGDGGGTGGAE